MAAKAVLGISPGTRVLGFSVIHAGELVEWRVKSFKDSWSKEKRNAILATVRKLYDFHNIGVIVIKRVDPLRSSPQLDRLVRNLIKQAKRYGIKAEVTSLSELEYGYSSSKKKTRADITQQVAERHPEVRKEYNKERNNRRIYYTKMFEAIALAESTFKTINDVA